MSAKKTAKANHMKSKGLEIAWHSGMLAECLPEIRPHPANLIKVTSAPALTTLLHCQDTPGSRTLNGKYPQIGHGTLHREILPVLQGPTVHQAKPWKVVQTMEMFEISRRRQ